MEDNKISNIDLELYFNISNFLKNKRDKDFIKYKDKFYEKFKTYDDKREIEYLVDYYKTNCNKRDEKYKIFKYIKFLKKIILISSFILGVGLTFLFFNKDININLYLITSVGLPLIYFIYLGWGYFRYTFPNKPEESILNWFLKKQFTNFSDEHSHILKTYSTMLLVEAGISYTIGVLAATIIIFSVFNVNFYSETTYGANDYKIDRNISDINNSTNIKTNQITTNYSGAYYSRFITLILVLMIGFKTILYLFTKKNNKITINLALINQGDNFLKALKSIVDIGLEDEEKNSSINNQKSKLNSIEKEDNINIESYYILYYEIEDFNIDKIEYNISNNSNLKDKVFKSFSYGLFDKEDDDINTLKKLNNLVIIYTSAETIPDETFKDNMLDIIKTDVNNIWIIPLKDDNNKLELLRKDDKDYQKWEKIITQIDDNRIRIHFDL